MKRRRSPSDEDNPLYSHFDKAFLNLTKQPAEIIALVLSYIPKYFLGKFLECEALVPHILPYITTHVRIGAMAHKDADPLNWFRLKFLEINEPVVLMEKLRDIVSKYGIRMKEASISLGSELAALGCHLADEKYNMYHYYVPCKVAIERWKTCYVDVLSHIDLLHIMDEFIDQKSMHVFEVLQRHTTIGSAALDFGRDQDVTELNGAREEINEEEEDREIEQGDWEIEDEDERESDSDDDENEEEDDDIEDEGGEIEGGDQEINLEERDIADGDERDSSSDDDDDDINEEDHHVIFPNDDAIVEKELATLYTSLVRFECKGGLYLTGQLLSQFEVLKIISLKSLLVSDFKFLPKTLESVKIQYLIENEDLVEVIVPKNLKNFDVSIKLDQTCSYKLVSHMKNLEVLRLEDSTIESIEELDLPASKITSLDLDYPSSLEDYSPILTFTNLKTLRIAEVPFPTELFHDENNLPNLRSFIFNGPEVFPEKPVFGRDTKFPRNLTELIWFGDVTIDRWKPPHYLQKLVLICPEFKQQRLFHLPKTLTFLRIYASNLKTLDNYQFPTGLKPLELHDNDDLESMKNTNLKKLKELVYVDFCDYGISLEPYLFAKKNPTDTNHRYQFNSFTMDRSVLHRMTKFSVKDKRIKV
ncbi:hypothetical protein Cantr_10443 [Candida viswanathii]|uniref:Uncharacterized protein n=1 Tax=Candida viswanathii TaxID=5486 RepID=A0A367YGW2_9ASCO|nr:hypothetical protein Cantr_10443 [Candida viswanathii]